MSLVTSWRWPAVTQKTRFGRILNFKFEISITLRASHSSTHLHFQSHTYARAQCHTHACKIMRTLTRTHTRVFYLRTALHVRWRFCASQPSTTCSKSRTSCPPVRQRMPLTWDIWRVSVQRRARSVYAPRACVHTPHDTHHHETMTHTSTSDV